MGKWKRNGICFCIGCMGWGVPLKTVTLDYGSKKCPKIFGWELVLVKQGCMPQVSGTNAHLGKGGCKGMKQNQEVLLLFDNGLLWSGGGIIKIYKQYTLLENLIIFTFEGRYCNKKSVLKYNKLLHLANCV
jgi:hypothetical protein